MIFIILVVIWTILGYVAIRVIPMGTISQMVGRISLINVVYFGGLVYIVYYAASNKII